MRVKELADLTGTSVRAVRHYHQLGLLPVPEERLGYRDYDLSHVARLSRIRWLAQAGVPLARVAGMMPVDDGAVTTAEDAGRAAIVTDLRATLVELDNQLDQLTRQREQVDRLVESVERNDVLSPLPPAVARFYDDLETRAVHDRVRREIRRERDFIELAFYRGEMPAEVALFYEGFDEVGRADSLAGFGELAEQDASGRAMTPADIEHVASAVVARMEAVLGADFPRFAAAMDTHAIRRAAELYVALAPEDERALVRHLADAVLAALEEVSQR